MRSILPLLLALVLTSNVSAQEASGEPVASWYEITSGDRTERIQARSVEVRAQKGRQVVLVDGREMVFRQGVMIVDLGPDPRPNAEGDHGRVVSEVIISTTVSSDGSVNQRVISNTKNTDGSTTHTQTNTSTTQNDDGSTTTSSSSNSSSSSGDGSSGSGSSGSGSSGGGSGDE